MCSIFQKAKDYAIGEQFLEEIRLHEKKEDKNDFKKLFDRLAQVNLKDSAQHQGNPKQNQWGFNDKNQGERRKSYKI